MNGMNLSTSRGIGITPSGTKVSIDLERYDELLRKETLYDAYSNMLDKKREKGDYITSMEEMLFLKPQLVEEPTEQEDEDDDF